MAGTNYADAYGYNSIAAAIVFTILYVPLCGFFILRSFKNPTYVTLYLLSASSTGENLGLFIADEVLFGIGFFGLLYAAYTLVLDNYFLSSPPILSRLSRSRGIFQLSLTAENALEIAGITTELNDPTSSTGNALRKASVILSLVLTILQAYRTVVLVRREIEDGQLHLLWGCLPSLTDSERVLDYYREHAKTFGEKHGPFILYAISILLIVREAFLTATIDNPEAALNEHSWYPLVALPEILAVILYCAPGLVPPRFELPK
ncbi:uncharacterized protein ARMOST_00041 [Armillaria ostoyae]|uniref:RTA1 domain protein n=1 Tax=Armillaria ostoyae TaxID=47428 RepID=A0A284QK07_ARMOS|nr:uncharacterized protein ARMOST_00041 [Armillaria ostoyae]